MPVSQMPVRNGRRKMRRDRMVGPNRVVENEAFWATMLAVAVAAGLGLLVFAMVGR